MNCIGCPYSYADVSKGIEVYPQPVGASYCKLGFPIECAEDRLPKELDNNS
jgi:hypothetical protein